MQLIELGKLTPITQFSYVAPFVASTRPRYKIIEASLLAIFPDEPDNNNRIFVNGFFRGPFVSYQVTSSQVDCEATEKSMYWDHENQMLYIHFEHEYYYDTNNYNYETYDMYNDLDIVYIDGQESLPLINSVPAISKQQDLVNYQQFALNTGTASLNNVGGELDKYIGQNLFGNTVFNSYIDPDDIQTDESGTKYADRSAIVRLAPYYIDDYSDGVQEWVFDLKDPRGRQNVDICTDLFTESDYPNISDDYKNKPIQLAFGQIREMNAFCVDGEDTSLVNPRYRAALEMTDFGTIQVLIDKTWTTVTPILEDLENGEFVLFGTDALNDDGEPLECRLLNATGVAVTYGSDPIKWLNEYYAYLDYNDSFYDTDEWESESASLEPIGILFKEKKKLYEAIALIQNGCNYGFRYDYNNEGKITLRLDREDRECLLIDNLNIENRFELAAQSDREQAYSYIDCYYNQSFSEDGKKDLVINSDWLSYQDRTRQAKRLELNTYLITEAAARARSALDALRYREVPKIFTFEIKTPTKAERTQLLNLRIFDIIKTALTFSDDVDFDSETITGRELNGIKGLKIVSVAPVPANNNITVTAKLLPDYTPYYVFDFSASDPEILFDFSSTLSTVPIINFEAVN